jgi:hypothetical protein
MDELREQAMRTAFEQVYRLTEAMTALSSNASASQASAAVEIERLGTGADALSRPWETGPDAMEWDWLFGAVADWRVAPEAMHRLMDELHHDARTGDTPFSPVQIRSFHQAGLLVDPIYPQQLQWRQEHLANAAELGRLNARLETPGLTDRQWENLATTRDQMHAARETAALTWTVEQRVWEQRYAGEPANRAEERDAYTTAHAAERTRIATAPTTDTATNTADVRPGARISQLLGAAAPRSQQPTAATPHGPQTDPAEAATVLGTGQPNPAAGHELG